MGTRTISTKLAIEGESQYRQAVKNCNSELSTMKSQLALVESQFQAEAGSMAALTAKGEALAQMYDKQKNKVDTLRGALDNAKNAQAAYAAKTEEYKDKIASAEQALDKLKNSTDDTSEEQAALTKEIEQYKRELGETEGKQEAAARGVNDWQRQLNLAQRDLNNLDAEISRNDQLLDQARDSTDDCADSVDKLGQQTKQAAEDSEDFGSRSTEAIDALAGALAAAGVAATLEKIASGILSCVKAAAAFEAQMSTVQAISGASADDMDKLAETAKYMGATTSFTAVQAGQALEYMGMAGWKAGQMVDALPGVMNLAAAAGEDLAMTSDIITDALTAFGLKAEDSAHFADVLAKASSNSNTNVAMMGETFKYAGAVAGALGYSVEDTAVAVGAMANAGIKAEMAGTALRGMLTNLAKPSDQVAGYMKELNLSLTDAGGQVKPLNLLLSEMREKFADLTDAQKAEYAAGIAGKNAMSGMLAIVNAAPEDWDKLTDAIANCNGAAEEMAQTRLDNYEGQLTLLGSAMEGLQIAIGSALTPALADLAGTGADVASFMTEAINNSPGLVQAFTALSVGAATLTAGVVGYTAATKLAQVATAVFGNILGKSPVFLAATAVAALAATLGTFVFTASSAASETRSLMRELEQSERKHADSASAIRATAEAADVYIEKLERLEAQSGMTDVEQLEYAQTVEKLNALIPDLNLKLDEQTGLLEGGTAALREQTQAWQENALQKALQEMYGEVLDGQAKATIELTQRKLELKQAQEELAQIQAQSAEVTQELARIETNSTLSYEEKANAAAELKRKLSDLTGQYGNAQDHIRNCQAALEDSEQAAEAYSGKIEELNAVQEEFSGAAKESAGASNVMKQAFSTLETACERAQSAYAEAAAQARESIDKQIGQWELLDNKVKTSADKINQALTSQIQYLQNYSNNLKGLAGRNIEDIDQLVFKLSDGSKESAAILAGLADASDDTIREVIANLAKVEEGKQTLAGVMAELEPTVQIAMRQVVDASNKYEEMRQAGVNSMQGLLDGVAIRAQDVINKYTYVADMASAAFRKAMRIASPSKLFQEYGGHTIEGYMLGVEERENELAEVMKAAAELAIEAFGEDNDEAKELAKEFLDEYNESLAITAENAKVFAEETEKQLERITDAMEQVEKKQESMQKKLQDYGDLFQVDSKTGKMTIESLDEQIEAIERYEQTLNGLRNRGVSGSLLDEIIAMGVDEATAYGDQLLHLTDEGWADYNKKWEEKQSAAKKVAEDFYKSELDTLKNDFSDQLERGLDDLKHITFNSGVDAMEGLMEGLQSKKSELFAEAQYIADQISSIINSALSSSGGKGKKDGSHEGGLSYVPYDGYLAELHKGERVLTADETQAYITARTPSSFDLFASSQYAQQQQTAAMVNAFGTLVSGLAAPPQDGPVTIVVQLCDGAELGRALLPSIREAAAQSPEVERDF